MTLDTDYMVDFLKRAEELRSIAAAVYDKRVRERLLQFADDYEKLAGQQRGQNGQRGTLHLRRVW